MTTPEQITRVRALVGPEWGLTYKNLLDIFGDPNQLYDALIDLELPRDLDAWVREIVHPKALQARAIQRELQQINARIQLWLGTGGY